MTVTDDEIKQYVEMENENRIVAPAPSKLAGCKRLY